MTEAQIFQMIADGLHETFGLDRAAVTLDADLKTDLDLDSIDAVDLIARLQRATGKRLTPEAFKSVRTVRDVVRAVDASLRE